jgi:hypothetical protein
MQLRTKYTDGTWDMYRRMHTRSRTFWLKNGLLLIHLALSITNHSGQCCSISPHANAPRSLSPEGEGEAAAADDCGCHSESSAR